MFSLGGQFKAFVRKTDNNGEGAWQRVDPEPRNPTSLHVVALTSSRELLSGLQVVPSVVTPNGDGVNQYVSFEFAVFVANLDNTVKVGIYDLSGRQVRVIREKPSTSSGRYAIQWNGRDDERARVSPGVYTVVLTVDAPSFGADVSAKSLLGTVAIAY